MPEIEGTTIRDRIHNVIDEANQLHENGVDLTVNEVFKLNSIGSVDFGGSEYRQAGREKILVEKADTEDDYGWWQLEEGHYNVRYNETVELRDDEMALVIALSRLQRSGVFLPACTIDPDQPLETLLIVGKTGCRLKENCRISRLLIL